MKKLGIMGGTFDPPHLGHLILAQTAEEFLGLDRVVFVPTAESPLKGRPPAAPAAARLAMVRAAVAERRKWGVSDWEIRQGGASYSVRTAAHLHREFPDAELFWIIGADQLAQLNAWHRIDELCRLVRFVVAVRDGDELERPAHLHPCVKIEALPMRRFDVSSTEIRARLGAGLPVAFFLPERVREVIEQGKFYC